MPEFEYNIENALLWGNCVNNFEKSLQAKGGKRFALGLLSAVEAIPIIGQAISLIETGVHKLQGRVKKQQEVPQELQDQMTQITVQSQRRLTQSKTLTAPEEAPLLTAEQKAWKDKAMDTFKKFGSRFQIEQDPQSQEYQLKFKFSDQSERDAALANVKTHFRLYKADKTALAEEGCHTGVGNTMILSSLVTKELAGFPPKATEEQKKQVLRSLHEETATLPSGKQKAFIAGTLSEHPLNPLSNQYDLVKARDTIQRLFSRISPDFKVENNDEGDYQVEFTCPKENARTLEQAFKELLPNERATVTSIDGGKATIMLSPAQTRAFAGFSEREEMSDYEKSKLNSHYLGVMSSFTYM